MAFEVRLDTLRFGECHGLAPWIVAIVAKERAPHTLHATGLPRGTLRLSLALTFPSDERKNPRGKPVAFVSGGSRVCSEKRNDPRGEPVAFRSRTHRRLDSIELRTDRGPSVSQPSDDRNVRGSRVFFGDTIINWKAYSPKKTPDSFASHVTGMFLARRDWEAVSLQKSVGWTPRPSDEPFGSPVGRGVQPTWDGDAYRNWHR